MLKGSDVKDETGGHVKHLRLWEQWAMRV